MSAQLRHDPTAAEITFSLRQSWYPIPQPKFFYILKVTYRYYFLQYLESPKIL